MRGMGRLGDVCAVCTAWTMTFWQCTTSLFVRSCLTPCRVLVLGAAEEGRGVVEAGGRRRRGGSIAELSSTPLLLCCMSLRTCLHSLSFLPLEGGMAVAEGGEGGGGEVDGRMEREVAMEVGWRECSGVRGESVTKWRELRHWLM